MTSPLPRPHSTIITTSCLEEAGPVHIERVKGTIHPQTSFSKSGSALKRFSGGAEGKPDLETFRSRPLQQPLRPSTSTRGQQKSAALRKAGGRSFSTAAVGGSCACSPRPWLQGAAPASSVAPPTPAWRPAVSTPPGTSYQTQLQEKKNGDFDTGPEPEQHEQRSGVRGQRGRTHVVFAHGCQREEQQLSVQTPVKHTNAAVSWR